MPQWGDITSTPLLGHVTTGVLLLGFGCRRGKQVDLTKEARQP